MSHIDKTEMRNKYTSRYSKLFQDTAQLQISRAAHVQLWSKRHGCYVNNNRHGLNDTRTDEATEIMYHTMESLEEHLKIVEC